MVEAKLITLARDFLAEAREQLKEYERTANELSLRQACEKGWGSVTQALMYAAGRTIETHKEFGLVATELFRKTGNRIFLDAETAGEYLHSAGFYHGLPTAELVSRNLDLIEELVQVAERIS